MSNHAWVCFSCRAAVRREGSSRRVLCLACGRNCECIGYKTPVPPKSKPKEWERLRRAFHEARRSALLKREQARVRRVHDLEQEIARLEALPSNPGRRGTIAHLRTRLDATKGN